MFSLAQTIFKRIGITAAVALLLLSPALVSRLHAETGIVRVDDLNLRPTPGKSSVPITTLSRGTKLKIIAHTSGWLYVTYQDRPGYVVNDPRYITIVQDPPDATAAEKARAAEKIRRQADAISHKIEKHQAGVRQIARKETEIINTLDQLDQDLNRSAKRVTGLKAEQAAVVEQIRATRMQSTRLLEKINAGEAYAAGRITALYKLGRMGHLQVLASAKSMVELFQRQFALQKIIAYDREVLEALAENRHHLQTTLAELSRQNTRLQTLEQTLAEQITKLADARKKRTRILADIRKQKSLELAAIESLKAASHRLDLKMRSVDRLPAPAGSAVNNPPKCFSAHKGLLKMPVKGKIMCFFGPYRNNQFNVVNFQSGIDIKAERGEPVRAVCSGTVLYADWFKGYGNMLIINHGDNYYTLYAHAEELFKSQGDSVEKDEVIATVGDTGSMAGPKLHFEVRHHGKPMDPMPWIRQG